MNFEKKDHRSSVILAELFPQNVLLCRVDGWTGGRVDGGQKGPLIFFILRYIKHYTHIYIYMYIKNVLANFLWV